MLPLNSIPTEVIRKSLVPYQGFMLPFEIDLTPRDRAGLFSIMEQISRLDTAKQAELRIDPTPIFKIFVDLFGYDLQALQAGGGECGVPEHDWNTYGRPERLPLVIRWRAFGGEALLCFGGINAYQYYVAAIADKAIERNTGARGLRAILEEILGPIMFELPGSPITGTVMITKSVVLTGETPEIVPFNTVREKSA